MLVIKWNQSRLSNAIHIQTNKLSFVFILGSFRQRIDLGLVLWHKTKLYCKNTPICYCRGVRKMRRVLFFVLIMDLNNKLAWGIHLIPRDMPNRFVQSIYTAHTVGLFFGVCLFGMFYMKTSFDIHSVNAFCIRNAFPSFS